jgi:hypothetical protein
MSLRQHRNARVENYAGPHYPDGVKELTLLFDSEDMTPERLKWFAEQFYHSNGRIVFEGLRPLFKTIDGYVWYFGLAYKEGGSGNRIIVTVPYYRAPESIDDTHADRCVAVYYTGFPVYVIDSFMANATELVRRMKTPA